MKKFAGVDLACLSLESCSDARLHKIQDAFLNNFLRHIRDLQEADKEQEAKTLEEMLNKDNFYKTSGYSVVKHLINYIKISITPTISDDQDMALAIRFLPDTSGAPFPGQDDALIERIKIIIGDYHYNLRDIKKMIAKINTKKSELDFANNWGESVERTTSAVRRQNLLIAYEVLFRIAQLSKNPNLSREDLACVLSLQIAYYIDILKLLINNLGRNPLVDFYVAVENEFKVAVKKLQGLPEVDSKSGRDNVLCSMFFSSMRRLAVRPSFEYRSRKNKRAHPSPFDPSS